VRRLLLVLALLLAGCGQESGGGTADGLDVTTSPSPVGPATPDGSCPPEHPAVAGPWVPETPSTDTEGRLVPDADPVLAVVCRYAERPNSGPPQSAALVDSTEVTDGLRTVRTDLHLPGEQLRQGRVCTDMGGSLVPHLVRFDYADGSLWLSAAVEPNRCTNSGNGAFTTGAYLGQLLGDAFDTGRWPGLPPTTCGGGGPGRAGQEAALLPDGWTALTSCRRSPDGAVADVVLSEDDAQQVAELLGRAELAPGSGGCGGGDGYVYSALAEYPEGNPVAVDLNVGCEPPLRNGSLDGVLPLEQQRELAALLARR
jgi:hypothetical protein